MICFMYFGHFISFFLRILLSKCVPSPFPKDLYNIFDFFFIIIIILRAVHLLSFGTRHSKVKCEKSAFYYAFQMKT